MYTRSKSSKRPREEPLSHCSYVLDEIQNRRSKQAVPDEQSSSSNVVSSVLNVEHSIVKCNSIGEQDEIQKDNIANKVLIPHTVNNIEVGTKGSDDED